MPFYEIQHSFPLLPEQKSVLASEITTLHGTTFSAPSLFVNIKFSSIAITEDYFIGGQRRTNTNRIFGHVRSGQGRGDQVFAKLAEDIESVWNRVVERGPGDFGVGNWKVLHGVFIVPGLTAREQGFAIPVAGLEGAWLESNWENFKARADAGDEDMKNLVTDVESRPELLKKGSGA